jgi:hypothetical protein
MPCCRKQRRNPFLRAAVDAAEDTWLMMMMILLDLRCCGGWSPFVVTGETQRALWPLCFLLNYFYYYDYYGLCFLFDIARVHIYDEYSAESFLKGVTSRCRTEEITCFSHWRTSSNKVIERTARGIIFLESTILIIIIGSTSPRQWEFENSAQLSLTLLYVFGRTFAVPCFVATGILLVCISE